MSDSSDPMDCSLAGSSVHGIFQAKVLEWGAIAFSARWLSGKEFACQCRRQGLDPWVRKIPGEGNGSPLQYACLEDSMGRGAWQAADHRISKELNTT